MIRRSDGSPAFFFSNAPDDALMAVTHVLRGEDHLSNTPRQLLLLEALGLPAPRYGHIALVPGEDGTPLGKRQGSRSVRALRDQGYFPIALDNTLSRLGHAGLPGPRRPRRRVFPGPPRTRPGTFRCVSARLLAARDHRPQHPGRSVGMDKPFGRRAGTRKDAADLRRGDPRQHCPPTRFSGPGSCTAMISRSPMRRRAYWQICGRLADLSGLAGELKTRLRVSGKPLFLPLRAALTGRIDGPDLSDLTALMPRERVRERFAALIKEP